MKNAILFIVGLSIAISLGFIALTGRYKVYENDVSIIKTDTWTGTVYVSGGERLKEGWIKIPNKTIKW